MTARASVAFQPCALALSQSQFLRRPKCEESAHHHERCQCSSIETKSFNSCVAASLRFCIKMMNAGLICLCKTSILFWASTPDTLSFRSLYRKYHFCSLSPMLLDSMFSRFCSLSVRGWRTSSNYVKWVWNVFLFIVSVCIWVVFWNILNRAYSTKCLKLLFFHFWREIKRML